MQTTESEERKIPPPPTLPHPLRNDEALASNKKNLVHPRKTQTESTEMERRETWVSAYGRRRELEERGSPQSEELW